MKRILFFAIILLPPPIWAMHEQNEKEYYEKVMGSLVLVKETETESGSKIEGNFRKGGTVSCTKDNEGKVQGRLITKNGEEIEPEALLDTPENLYDSLKKKALRKQAEQFPQAAQTSQN